MILLFGEKKNGYMLSITVAIGKFIHNREREIFLIFIL